MYQFAYNFANYINFLVLFVQFNRRRLAKLAAQKRAERERQRCALLAYCAHAPGHTTMPDGSDMAREHD
jgi:sulfatase maturation enzyme AslB (radical SAM superfamily)